MASGCGFSTDPGGGGVGAAVGERRRGGGGAKRWSGLTAPICAGRTRLKGLIDYETRRTDLLSNRNTGRANTRAHLADERQSAPPARHHGGRLSTTQTRGAQQAVRNARRVTAREPRAKHGLDQG